MGQQEIKKFEWKVIRVGGITIAQGYQCPDCKTIGPKPECNCQQYNDKEEDP